MFDFIKNRKKPILSVMGAIIVIAVIAGVYYLKLENQRKEDLRVERANYKAEQKAQERLQSFFNTYTKARFDLLTTYDNEQAAIAALRAKKEQFEEAHKKWTETGEKLEADYDAQYARVRANNANVSEYYDYEANEYKTRGTVLPYPTYPKMPDEPEFPSFAADIQVLMSIKTALLENSNIIEDLETEPTKDREHLQDMKKYMLRLNVMLLGQVEDVIRDAKNSPAQFDADEYDVSRLIADIKSLNSHRDKCLSAYKLKDKNPLRDSKTEKLR